MPPNQKINLSIIVPVFNEKQAIVTVVENLKTYFETHQVNHEIIVIDDGSQDGTADILEQITDIRTIHHPYNKGYGASLKTGATNARHDWLLFFDGDGQHKTEDIAKLIEHADRYDMVIGARQGYKGPIFRQPGKKILHWVANYLAEKKIPDLNSGFRLVKKEYFLKYQHIFPDGFSLSTTSTLAFFKEGHNIKYVPISINKRVGKSTVGTYDGFKTLMLILRLIMLFSPLKIFLPLSMLGFLVSAIWAIHDLIISHLGYISKSSGFIFVASLLIFLVGLLADQIAAIRREIKDR